jgi:uncharacterized protein YecE (DUF72 family)
MIYIGTSGWHYKHWKGLFYPAGMPQQDYLPHYLRYFQTVEVNNSFYRLPSYETFANWRVSVPEGFVFAVKASRFITLPDYKSGRAETSSRPCPAVPQPVPGNLPNTYPSIFSAFHL